MRAPAFVCVSRFRPKTLGMRLAPHRRKTDLRRRESYADWSSVLNALPVRHQAPTSE